ncbi:MAG: BLUF domain-containing protein [Rubripirellula sp.]|nr:BLUF domain-containing protein [Rubripirellula sp.]
MLRRVIYTSLATNPLDKRALLDLLHEARGFNHIDGITGLLMHDEGHFLQVVEGPVEEIANLVKRLKRDGRHEHFEIHEDVQTESRLFPEWSMGFGDLSDPALAFLPNIISQTEHQQRLAELVGRLPDLAKRLNIELGENSK